ncbi:MAG TPA: ATP-binding protein [Myxococcales bacterium]
MSFRTKIWAAMAVAGIVPLLLLGVLSYSTGRRELGETVGRLQAQSAREVARRCERLVSDAVANLKLSVSYLPFDQLPREELSQVLAIPYRQLPFVNALALLDEKGQAVVPPVHEENPGAHPELAGHESVGDAELALFASHVPLAAALKSGAAVGPPYRSPGRGPRVVVAVRVPSSAAQILAAEVSLSEMQARFSELSAAGTTAFLVDASGSLLAHGGGEQAALSETESALVKSGLAASASQVELVRRDDGEWLAAFEPVQRLGWGIVVAERGASAFAAANRVLNLTLLWGALAVLLTLALGTFLAASLTRPVKALSLVAQAATAGTYAPAKGVEGNDELGAFAKAFNHMIEEIQRRDVEIRGWNEELQQRVDQRTAELKDAQDQILRTRRLAALGSLGAGVAHELNNPLTSILGLLTLLKRELPPDSSQAESIKIALDQTKRVSKIVNDLRLVAASEHAQAGKGKRFPPGSAVSAALDSCADQLRAGKVTLESELANGLPDLLGDPLQIQQLVTHLVQNALGSMPDGGALKVGLRAVDGEAVKLTVADTGKNIPPDQLERVFDPFFSTQENATRLSVGLSVCHAITEAHHGKIAVESPTGKGTTFTVLLPAAPAQASIY